MATTEHTINDILAEVLQGKRRAWTPSGVVRSENTGALLGNAKRPDVLIVEPDAAPAVVETEILPAASTRLYAVQAASTRWSGWGCRTNAGALTYSSWRGR